MAEKIVSLELVSFCLHILERSANENWPPPGALLRSANYRTTFGCGIRRAVIARSKPGSGR